MDSSLDLQKRLDKIRSHGHGGRQIRLHRAIYQVSLHKGNLLIALLLPLVFNLALLFAIERIVPFWFAVLKFWFAATDLPGTLIAAPFDLVVATVWLPRIDLYAGAPSQLQWWISALSCVVLWIGTRFIPPTRMLPLIYAVRAVVLIQISALVYFALVPASFPHGLGSYLFSGLSMGLILMFLAPWILGFTYYVFNFPLHQKVALTLLVLAYFALALPFQFALHTVLLWHLSLLFLPLFYLLFGSFLDVMMFIAFYAWGMSWDWPPLTWRRHADETA
ncbi:hypothetical protein OTERR_01530 [Oryzomicrobium terrae]|uniref:Transmembrane protein n=1 Tax=Oryzomicrobium terrae TaxID=1735038 RepID=A0A5C1E520_9RHOO|nr:hypothetical protein [Oryzomicrobium terrae]QEL63629.1 hypothetical protein OTERR_01530 [Oryzomicrobium terrae]